jgi:hypothetical protein
MFADMGAMALGSSRSDLGAEASESKTFGYRAEIQARW